jgi:MFS family permease
MAAGWKATRVTNASLSWLSLFVSNMQTGFGPFVSVHLTSAGWDPAMIGKVLSASTVAAVVAQVPAGAVCDAVMAKRGVAAAAIVAIMAAAVLLATMPSFGPVLVAEAMQGAGGVVLALAIANITLSLTQHDQLGERLGNNLRFAAIGGAGGAALLGVVGNQVSPPAVFFLAAGFGVPALLALWSIHPLTIVQAPLRTGHRAAMPKPIRGPVRSTADLLTDRRLLALMGCVLLFHLANAALLPLAAGSLARHHGTLADLVVSGAIIVPLLITAIGSPFVGRLATRAGRRPILLLGFAMLPIRGVLFSFADVPELVLPAQILDGVTGTIFGVIVPLLVADLTHEGGRFNLALGMVGFATSIGATISNYAAGLVASHMGVSVAFLYLAGVGGAATLLLWLTLPETMHLPETPPLHPDEFRSAMTNTELVRT